MNYLSYRNLADLGFSEDHIKAIAAEHLVLDGPNDEGEMFERDGIPSDQFVNPYLNEKLLELPITELTHLIYFNS